MPVSRVILNEIMKIDDNRNVLEYYSVIFYAIVATAPQRADYAIADSQTVLAAYQRSQ